MPAPLILVVEDEPSLREILAFQIESAGFRVMTTSSAAEALRIAGESRPDLVLTDWHMPGASGLELVQSVRESTALRGIPIIVLSARTTAADKALVLESGANDHVSKPWEREELILRIRNLVEWEQRRQHDPGA